MKPYPQYDICTHTEEEEQECMKEHNPLPGYEDHHYGCECSGCVQWYWLLKE